MLYCLPCLLTEHIVNKNANYKILVVFDQNTWNTKYRFEFVIPYTGSKVLIPPNTTSNDDLKPSTVISEQPPTRLIAKPRHAY